MAYHCWKIYKGSRPGRRMMGTVKHKEKSRWDNVKVGAVWASQQAADKWGKQHLGNHPYVVMVCTGDCEIKDCPDYQPKGAA